METIDERTIKEKWEVFKWNCKKKTREVKQFCKDHPQAALFGATTIVGGLSFGGKRLAKHRDFKLIECRHYDRRTDTYWISKRPLKTSEKMMMDKLYSEGRSKGEILNQMGLLR